MVKDKAIQLDIVGQLFFILSGVMALICWNSILNLGIYFDNAIHDGIFDKMIYSFSIGSLLAFIVESHIFGKFKVKNTLIISLLFLIYTFLFVMTTPFMGLSKGIESTLLLIHILFCGFFSSIFQAKSTAMSAILGKIRIFNFGTGIAGASTNLYLFIVQFFFKITEYDTKPIIIEQLKKQAVCYIIMVGVILAIQIIITIIFLAENSELLEYEQEQLESLDTPLVEEKMVISTFKVIKNAFDLLWGIFYNYTIIILFVSALIIKT